MQIGMIGLGRMGASMVAPSIRRRPSMRGLRRNQDSVKELARKAPLELPRSRISWPN